MIKQLQDEINNLQINKDQNDQICKVQCNLSVNSDPQQLKDFIRKNFQQQKDYADQNQDNFDRNIKDKQAQSTKALNSRQQDRFSQIAAENFHQNINFEGINLHPKILNRNQDLILHQNRPEIKEKIIELEMIDQNISNLSSISQIQQDNQIQNQSDNASQQLLNFDLLKNIENLRESDHEKKNLLEKHSVKSSDQEEEIPHNAGYGSFLKQMQYWAKDVSYEDQVYDIWKKQSVQGQSPESKIQDLLQKQDNKEGLRLNQGMFQLSNKYVINFHSGKTQNSQDDFQLIKKHSCKAYKTQQVSNRNKHFHFKELLRSFQHANQIMSKEIEIEIKFDDCCVGFDKSHQSEVILKKYQTFLESEAISKFEPSAQIEEFSLQDQILLSQNQNIDQFKQIWKQYLIKLKQLHEMGSKIIRY